MTDAIARLTVSLVDRYRIERELGQGGMATVYLAHDVRHDRKVALKVLRPELAAILGGERFLAEIKTTANLQHPHILSLFDSGEADGLVYYVMPYVDGESLRDRLQREKQLPVDDAVRIAKEVADALEYAHQHGVVHRDIKPENILLHGGHAMVADFGIALAASRSDGGTRMTETGMSLGTPHYMAPEQAMGEREITPKADIYALGCVLYEMLTAEPPFVGATAQAIIARVMTEEPRSLTLQRKTIPPHVEAAVERSLSKLPADRFASAAEFAKALDDQGYGRADAQTRRRAEPAGRRRGASAVLPWLVTLVAVAAGAWAYLRPQRSHDVNRYVLGLPDSAPLAYSSNRRIAISHDGRVIVYIGSVPNGTKLFALRRDGLTAVPLPGTDGAYNPAFSPDDRKLAFISGTPRALKVLTFAGGTVGVLTDSLVDNGGVSWGYDGYVYYDGHLQGDGLARVRETGGHPEVATMPRTDSGELWHAQPEALPGGRGVLFGIRRSDGAFDVGVTDGKGGPVRVLVRGIGPHYADGHVLYVTPAGALMALPFDLRRLKATGEAVAIAADVGTRSGGRVDVAVSSEGTLVYGAGLQSDDEAELVWVTQAGVVTPVDSTWRGRFRGVAVSTDGRRAAVTMATGGGADIWIKQLDHGPASRLTFEAVNYSPTWKPDGRSLLFVTTAGATVASRILESPADGSSVPHLVRADTGVAIGGIRVSPDGRWILMQVRGRILGTQVGGDSTRRELVSAGTYNAVGGRLSPDGRWIAYASDESGRWEVYVRPFPNTADAKRQVSTGGANNPAWSRDGRHLFLQSLAGRMMVADVQPGASFTASAPRPLFSTEGMLAGGLGFVYDVGPDGRFLMVRYARRVNPDHVVVVENLGDVLSGRAVP